VAILEAVAIQTLVLLRAIPEYPRQVGPMAQAEALRGVSTDSSTGSSSDLGSLLTYCATGKTSNFDWLRTFVRLVRTRPAW
jgi:hypothetical protein